MHSKSALVLLLSAALAQGATLPRGAADDVALLKKVNEAGIMKEVITQPGLTIVEKLEHANASKPEVKSVLDSEEFKKAKDDRDGNDDKKKEEEEKKKEEEEKKKKEEEEEKKKKEEEEKKKKEEEENKKKDEEENKKKDEEEKKKKEEEEKKKKEEEEKKKQEAGQREYATIEVHDGTRVATVVSSVHGAALTLDTSGSQTVIQGTTYTVANPASTSSSSSSSSSSQQSSSQTSSASSSSSMRSPHRTIISRTSPHPQPTQFHEQNKDDKDDKKDDNNDHSKVGWSAPFVTTTCEHSLLANDFIVSQLKGQAVTLQSSGKPTTINGHTFLAKEAPSTSHAAQPTGSRVPKKGDPKDGAERIHAQSAFQMAALACTAMCVVLGVFTVGA